MYYKIKNVAKRGTFLTAAVSMLAGITSMALPSVTFADALNPLTERSLSLSSSSPGFHYLDGSGNPTYAAPGTGNNGQKTGETFSFRMSSASGTIKALTFQYCTTAAGNCQGPGNDLSDPGGSDDTSHSDLNVVKAAGATEGIAADHTSTNNFEIWTAVTGDCNGSFTGTQGSGWTMSTSNLENGASSTTGKKNLITLTNSTGYSTTAGQKICVKFYGTDTSYITNPGLGAFYVKINTYDTTTPADLNPVTSTHIIDGGVTVANVMNDSIWIQTKVLETMSFSVGTTNPDTDNTLGGHGTCDAITKNDPLHLGDPNGEYSLETNRAWDVKSYWRLSSNSSGGATVFYSGYTLSNTEGDQIHSIYNTGGGHVSGDGSSSTSLVGSEQFGLGFTTEDTGLLGSAQTNVLAPLNAYAAYANGAGNINGGNTSYGDVSGDPNAQFAFKNSSLTQPEPIAQETTDVIHCSTAKMRYIGNIAPDTPAGVYTTKINYIAAPQY